MYSRRYQLQMHSGTLYRVLRNVVYNSSYTAESARRRLLYIIASCVSAYSVLCLREHCTRLQRTSAVTDILSQSPSQRGLMNAVVLCSLRLLIRKHLGSWGYYEGIETYETSWKLCHSSCGYLPVSHRVVPGSRQDQTTGDLLLTKLHGVGFFRLFPGFPAADSTDCSTPIGQGLVQ
jgi:hypothetical protein